MCECVILWEHEYSITPTLIPRPSLAPVFNHLQYAKTASGSVFAYWKRSKTGAGEGLGTRLITPTSAT